tara:strand:+ start:69 stop:716 length:648 start_codon:yes stop_codon:yes gene_type:complete
MLYPTVVIDNFFDDPEMVLKHAEKFDYRFPKDGAYPGTRSDNTDLTFFQFTTKKMIAALYPMNYRSMTWSGDQFFQKINGKDYPDEGWVHQDWTSEITAIVYLSKDLGCGTAICTPKNYDKEIIFNDKKQNQYKEINNTPEKKQELKNYLEKNNSRYEKTIKVDSVFNRLVMFDSHSYHNVISFGDKERLTLVTFLCKVNSQDPIKYPLSELRRT